MPHTYLPTPRPSLPEKTNIFHGDPAGLPAFVWGHLICPVKLLKREVQKRRKSQPFPASTQQARAVLSCFHLRSPMCVSQQNSLLCRHQETEGPGQGWLWGCWPEWMAPGPQSYVGFESAQHLHLWAWRPALLTSIRPSLPPRLGWGGEASGSKACSCLISISQDNTEATLNQCILIDWMIKWINVWIISAGFSLFHHLH